MRIVAWGLAVGLVGGCAGTGGDGSADKVATEGSESTEGSDGSFVTDEDSGSGSDGLVQAPDFSLIDINVNSATYEDAISPRDRLEMVSGWYFTHAS